MTTDVPALTGTVSIRTAELENNILKVDRLLKELGNARTLLKKITTRPLKEAWSPVHSLYLFSQVYVGACSTTIAIIERAEVKVAGMADALRTFANEMQIQDQAALDALTALEARVDAALVVPTPPATGSNPTARIISKRLHHQAI